ncbi:MAG: prepilin-type N-terminal cleavage/methylation domain-containing protein [Rubrivivax sp.]|nr:prepilin-type N-terminal cleavage/methylation domain-containing protein [Rubrivivax sp.]
MLNALRAQHHQRGLSLPELMVGIVVGLIVVAGAIALLVGNVGTSRRLLIEARVNQDLRAAADVVAREVRRAGFWENAIAGTVTTATSQSAPANPNAAVSASASTITYSVARDTPEGRSATDSTLDDDEQFGFRLNGGVLEMQVGADSWQPLTDPNIITINNFAITPTETVLDIRASCAKPCTGSNCPTVTVRSYAISLRGTAVHDSSVARTLVERVRVRNDATAGVCPA